MLSYRIQNESLRMHEDESIANFFLRIDVVVNTMKGLGDKIKYSTVVEKILRSLTLMFNAKVSNIAKMQDLKKNIYKKNSWGFDSL